MKTQFLFSLGIVGSVVAFRLLPHPANFSPISGMLLLLPIVFPKQKLTILLVFAGLFISDLILGFHSTMAYVYGSYALIAFMGWKVQRQPFILPVVSSMLFYTITNFAVWAHTPMYSKDLQGLVQCYFMGIPFLRMTVLGDIFYFSLFSFGYFFLKKHWEVHLGSQDRTLRFR